jgi:TBC domain-containing protein kinase-like protein
LQEIYYLWQLAGGDVVSELGRHGLMVTMPPIVALPKLVLGEGHFQGKVKQLFS